jgi:TRAP-type uncharacterized transport system substrate-binding protein
MQNRRFDRSPVVMRSKLMLEVAAELVGAAGWEERQVQIDFREQGAPDWALSFFASDAPNSIDAVMSGEALFAICNPGSVLGMAIKGAAPYSSPLPLRSITVFPQFDAWGLAVTRDTGLTSIREIKEKRYPLRVSVRGQRDHSVHLVTDEILRAYGFSLQDIEAWGGQVRYDPGLPSAPGRISDVAAGKLDCIIDEAFRNYATLALDLDMRFLPIDEPEMQRLETNGLLRVVVTRDDVPKLPGDYLTVDFSGWPVFCREDASDEAVTAFCTALEQRKVNLPWYGDGPMDLKLMVSNSREAPLAIPLHPAAERFWKAQGYL